MALWLVRAGAHGDEEQGALEHNVATIGWNEMPDVSNNKQVLKELYLKFHPNAKKMSTKFSNKTYTRFWKNSLLFRFALPIINLKVQSSYLS
jgi:predicted Mrr-cat superfamily restriction endonuclease